MRRLYCEATQTFVNSVLSHDARQWTLYETFSRIMEPEICLKLISLNMECGETTIAHSFNSTGPPELLVHATSRAIKAEDELRRSLRKLFCKLTYSDLRVFYVLKRVH